MIKPTALDFQNPERMEELSRLARDEQRQEILDGFGFVVDTWKPMTEKARANIKREHRILFPHEGDRAYPELSEEFIAYAKEQQQQAAEQFGFLRTKRDEKGQPLDLGSPFMSLAPPRERKIWSVDPLTKETHWKWSSEYWYFWAMTGDAMVDGTPPEFLDQTISFPRIWPEEEQDALLDRVLWAPDREIKWLDPVEPSEPPPVEPGESAEVAPDQSRGWLRRRSAS